MLPDAHPARLADHQPVAVVPRRTRHRDGIELHVDQLEDAVDAQLAMVAANHLRLDSAGSHREPVGAQTAAATGAWQSTP